GEPAHASQRSPVNPSFPDRRTRPSSGLTLLVGTPIVDVHGLLDTSSSLRTPGVVTPRAVRHVIDRNRTKQALGNHCVNRRYSVGGRAHGGAGTRPRIPREHSKDPAWRSASAWSAPASSLVALFLCSRRTPTLRRCASPNCSPTGWRRRRNGTGSKRPTPLSTTCTP